MRARALRKGEQVTFLCAFCGDSIEAKNACPRESCTEARARIPKAEADSSGVPRIRKGRYTQPEGKRVRRAHQLRMLDSAWERIRSQANRERITIADFLERHALTLPPD
jgi:hypothetical protein